LGEAKKWLAKNQLTKHFNSNGKEHQDQPTASKNLIDTELRSSALEEQETTPSPN
jgi:hypothetical protein